MKAKSAASGGKVVSGRVELETHLALEQMARTQERTIGYLVRKAMEEYVAKHTPKQKKAGG